MKTVILIALMVICCINCLNAQDTINKKIYRTWVSSIYEPFKAKGVLYDINDSSIFIANLDALKYPPTERLKTVKIDIIYNVNLIKTRRNNNIGKGILIGAVSGFALGAILGLSSQDDEIFTSGQLALSMGGTLALFGIPIGAAIGAVKVKIPINGSIKTFHENSNRLKKYSYRK
jgi:hypothetical protein